MAGVNRDNKGSATCENSNDSNVEAEITPLQPNNTATTTTATTTAATTTITSTDPGLSRDLISIFVVTFDPKEGNILEWSLPKSVSLDGVEFRALISGAHTVTSDYIYFRQGDMFGVSCYQKMEIVSERERGVRMKSVGVLVCQYADLHAHLTHLNRMVNSVLHHPGEYKELEEYYNLRSLPHPPPTQWYKPPPPQPPPLPPLQTLQCKKDHEKGPMSLIRALRYNIITLWRASLLCKRIIIISEPPIGSMCAWVQCISLLASHTTPGLPSTLIRPLYYVSLADLDVLTDQHSYVACTTEKIFAEKNNIYDILIEEGRVRVVNGFPGLTTLTAEDKERAEKLLEMDCGVEDFKTHFQGLNDRIFGGLYRCCGGGGVVGCGEIEEMGLSFKNDKVFLRELANTHGFDVSVREGVCECACACV